MMTGTGSQCSRKNKIFFGFEESLSFYDSGSFLLALYLNFVYTQTMIKNFASKETEKIYHQEFSRKLPQAIQRIALRKLMMMDAATCLDDLRVPPANHLEALTGDRKGQHSIRINGQYRICFVWTGCDAENVEIVDYH